MIVLFVFIILLRFENPPFDHFSDKKNKLSNICVSHCSSVYFDIKEPSAFIFKGNGHDFAI